MAAAVSGSGLPLREEWTGVFKQLNYVFVRCVEIFRNNHLAFVSAKPDFAWLVVERDDPGNRPATARDNGCLATGSIAHELAELCLGFGDVELRHGIARDLPTRGMGHVQAGQALSQLIENYT